ncbi:MULTISPECIES: LysO family transporter [unclassified Desulfovibrio]|uniref:LysO family transporter n=1 Tax=unclassified Desulfovibrio TaxID=2593640 RepID=UPI0013EC0D25|nr:MULTISPECIES: LysO family transporter [unclassified Desulfovibrio]
MYTALGIMLCGMLAGRLLRGRLREEALRRWIFLAIMLLLFLLGVAVGGNERLVRDLPHLGGAALTLALGALGGTLAFAALLRPLFRDAPAPKTRAQDSQGPGA